MLAAEAALVSTLAACSSGGGEPSATTATTAPPPTFLDAVADRLNEDGTAPFALALDVFTAVFGDLPEHPAPKFPLDGLVDGTMAVSMLRAHWDELSTVQQSAAEKLIYPPNGDSHEGAVVAYDPKGAGAGGGGSAAPGLARAVHADRTDDLLAQVRALVLEFVAQIANPAHLARPLPWPVSVRALPPGSEPPSVGFVTTPLAPPGGSIDECLIQLNPDHPTNDTVLRAEVAHEVFHCFQHTLHADDPFGGDRLPFWLREGSAAWVGEAIGGGTAISQQWWQAWLTRPDRPLFARTYDAIGFYALLNASGVDPWRKFDEMLTNGASAFDRAVDGVRDQVLDRWGTSLARHPEWGAQWETRGPGVTTHRYEPTRVSVLANRGPRSQPRMPPGERTAEVAQVSVTGDVLVVTVPAIHGALRFGDGTALAFSGTARSVSYCLRDGGCACPGGGAPPGGALTTVASHNLLVAVADTSASQVTFEAKTLDRACEPTAPAAGGGDACLVGRWSSTTWTVPPVVGSISGGTGIVLQFAGDGTAEVDFGGMAPAVIRNDSAGIAVVSTFSYAGADTARWTAGSAALSLTYDHPDRPTITLNIEPGGPVYTNEPFSAVAGDGAGGVGPLTGGQYECSAREFTLRMSAGADVGDLTITFSKR
ncbi:MAG: hypothetical protein HYU28_09780 [Actinobacteria bacterium]|nr:hypothetical protein [Actinomycetota bacterium]